MITYTVCGNTSFTSHSATDDLGRKNFDEVQTGIGFITRQFTYHKGKVTDEHKNKEKLKSGPVTNLVKRIEMSDGRILSYEYDKEERIRKISESDKSAPDTVVSETVYTYDSLGQLIKEIRDGVVINEMTYDKYGNIKTRNGIAYTYGNSIWKDQLTGYGDRTISYDAQGNPVNYFGHTLTWEKGRQLKKYDSNTYTYNANGIRTGKTVSGVKHSYRLEGTKILSEKWGNNTLTPLYDNKDEVCGIVFNGASYYFLKNLQGDVISILDSGRNRVAEYLYDAWGVCTVVNDETEEGIAEVNPFRYRSYYYDSETGMYYLQSRYYDPVVGRFINADKIIGANGDYASYALYTYCGNCPVDRYDSVGSKWKISWKKVKNNINKCWNGFKQFVRTASNKTNRYAVNLGIDTAGIGAWFLNMSKDSNGVYHANFDCWQQYFGYNDFYDFMFDIGTSMDNRKFKFFSGNEWYILWAWKGNYINLGAGAELGIYYGGGPHWLVDKNLAMDMSMTLKYRGTTIITYSARTWWLTGFNPKYLEVEASDLQVSYTVKFAKKSMYKDFKSKHKDTWIFKNIMKTASYTF